MPAGRWQHYEIHIVVREQNALELTYCGFRNSKKKKKTHGNDIKLKNKTSYMTKSKSNIFA